LVRLQNEHGETVEDVDDEGVIAPLLTTVVDDRSFVCGRFIREYDDTYFSAPQMPDFIAELERLRPLVPREKRVALDRVRAAAERCHRENLYMCLVGD
jgi:hypothetical protein